MKIYLNNKRNNFIETSLSNFLISHFLQKHQFIIWSEIVRRKRQLYYLIVRRRFCIHIDHKDATYNKLYLYDLSDHYNSTKIAIWINYMNARATCLASSFHMIEICNIQQISHETEYNRISTLKQIVKYIVLFLIR